METTITKIQPVKRAEKRAAQKAADAKKLRVAAYCRVSTDLEEQQSSMKAQMEVFEKRIREHEDWKLVDVYADEGLSGTSTAKRKAFLRMMQDAEDGRIDYIITKSLSRFARNTLDCLTWVRRLKALGVYILFEKENIDTGSATTETILTVMSAFAQEESRSISENLKWGLRKGFEQGKVRWRDIYGYYKNENNEWIPDPVEADVIRQIFSFYEQGYTTPEIADALNDANIPTLNGKQWRASGILPLLANEKYIGDVCTQKFITVDFLTHKQKPNTDGALPSYYIRNHHEPIVDRKTFERVAAIRAMRDNRSGSTQYPYGAVNLTCPHCGRKLVQRSMNTSGPRLIWGCFTEEGCGKYAVKKWQLDEVVLKAAKKLPKPPKTVEYWWLDEYVESLEMTSEHVRIHWKATAGVEDRPGVGDDLSCKVRIPIRAWQHRPERIAEMYRNGVEKAKRPKPEQAKAEPPQTEQPMPEAQPSQPRVVTITRIRRKR